MKYMNQWFFYLKLLVLKISEKKVFFAGSCANNIVSCTLKWAVLIIRICYLIINTSPPQPSNPFLPPYKLHIYILVEDLDTH